MSTVIPGRRISFGETFYTDWGPRGGDCALLRAQVLHLVGGEVQISMETRSEQSTASPVMNTTVPGSSPRLLVMNAVGVKTAIYTALEGPTSPSRGFKEEYRFKVEMPAEEGAEYAVVRILQPVFFDNAVPAS
jgi:hypothetical protein